MILTIALMTFYEEIQSYIVIRVYYLLFRLYYKIIVSIITPTYCGIEFD